MDLHQRDVIRLFVYRELQKSPMYPGIIYEVITNELPNKAHNKSYFYVVIRSMKNEGYIQAIPTLDQRKKVVEITPKGKLQYANYKKMYRIRFLAIKKVIDRFVAYIRREHRDLKEEIIPLESEYRTYFSRVLSVKDLVRYVMLKELQKTKELNMVKVADILETRFGWKASSGYLYDLAHEMEQNHSVIGRWEDPVLRTKRFYRITDEGIRHFEQISKDTDYLTHQIQTYHANILKLFEE